MNIEVILLAALGACVAYSLPPEEVSASHIIKARSIDLNNAYGLAMETRLEKIVEPTGYKLDLEPFLDDGVYRGTVKIQLKWLQESDELSLHCDHELGISFWDVQAYPASDAEHPVERVVVKELRMDVKKPILTLYFEKPIPKGTEGHIELTYRGNIHMGVTEGFFKSTYTTDQSEEIMVAATQLRPNNARRMFPCFDEPGYKTPFEISVARPRNMVALSNTPIARTENITGEPNAVTDYFEVTPPMSTFTVGLVIADLKQLGNTVHYKDDNGNDIELRVWGRKEYLQALDGVGEKFLKVFSEVANMWQIPLPLKKLDMVALPNYQGVRPADNWGLIVFKESELSNCKTVLLVNEVLYQWLGVYVTPAWWSDAHINKALVNSLAVEIYFKINNGSDMDGDRPIGGLYSIYYEYSKRYPHSRITGIKQDAIATKITLLFRTLNYTLGGNTLKKGLRTFLLEHKYKTFVGDDIWNALTKSAIDDGKISKDIDLKIVAKSWIEKDRLPFLTVERKNDGKTVVLTQKVFLRDRPHDLPDADRLTWWLPVVIVREDNLDFSKTTPLVWMKNVKELTINDMPTKDKFIIINSEEIAPYLVNYDKDTWYLLSKFLQSEKRTQIPAITRAKLLHDAWNLAYAGELSFATALNMTLFLKTEEDHLVWEAVFPMLDHVGRHICMCIQGKFQAYGRHLLLQIYEKLGKEEKEGEEKWKTNLRCTVKSFLCSNGYKPCVKDAQEHYAKWMQAKNPDEGNPIANQYIGPVFTYGTRKEWEFGLQRVINFPPSRKQSERTYLLKTLAGCPIEEYKINRLLNITLLEGNGNFTDTDLFLIFSMLTGGSQGYTTLFHFLNNNWAVLKEKFASKTNLWDSLISAATGQFTTQEGLDLVSNLYVAHQGEFGSAEHIIETSMKKIREEAKWSIENIPVIEKWLDDYLARYGVKDELLVQN
ncbi:aminopeptidase N [Bombyx mandarina]|uniref:Aminopeptidase n=1 Tax=Bombyx mandarina TaxID=7092 RepID=A0A6J2K790_BOMMA|nr:aminopeptidase N [Bombyx mandarina]XP_028036141.1 aminopeptidase N [Bombyx mandarina]